MEGLTRLVAESLARHGFDRPLDYRRLQWSRWFRCDSHHSLLFVPSKPGVFAIAEEVMDLSSNMALGSNVEERRFSAASGSQPSAALAAAELSSAVESRQLEPTSSRRMLAVTQFYEADDMAFVLDRMLSQQNPMRARFISGRYFVRFVVIEDLSQRRSIASALNQWMVSSSQTATGIGSHFATSLELTPATEYIPQPDERQANLFAEPDVADKNVARTPSPVTADSATNRAGWTLLSTNPDTVAPKESSAVPNLDSGAATNIHCPSPLPSGF